NQPPLLSILEARERKPRLRWSSDGRPAVPSFIGIRRLPDVPLEDIVPFIDWTPFFHAWELRGKYPDILGDKTVGPRAKEVFDDGQELLSRIVRGKLLRARGVYGFWPANSAGEDIELYTDESRTTVLATLHTLRQQTRKAQGEPNYSIADF